MREWHLRRPGCKGLEPVVNVRLYSTAAASQVSAPRRMFTANCWRARPWY